MNEDKKTFITLPEHEDEEHEVGDTRCPHCWSGFPRPCKCGGLIHAAFGDENYDGDFWLFQQCDQCGDKHDAM